MLVPRAWLQADVIELVKKFEDGLFVLGVRDKRSSFTIKTKDQKKVDEICEHLKAKGPIITDPKDPEPTRLQDPEPWD